MKLQTMILAAAVLASACSQAGGPRSAVPVTPVSIALATHAGSSGQAVAASQSFTDGDGNTLVVDSAFVVVRRMRLIGTVCGDEAENDTGEVHDSAGADGVAAAPLGDAGAGDEECGALRLGPMLVSLPLSGGADQQFTVSVDSGTYAAVMFQIHKPEGANDTAFVTANPDYAGTSIRLVGEWNGAPFVFTTGVTDVQRVDFDPPLVVGTTPQAFTLFVDLSGWFLTPTGSLVDPRTALDDSTNAPLVHANIERSFHAFRDQDHDGTNDDLEHHD